MVFYNVAQIARLPVVTGNIKIQLTIIVKIPKPSWKTHDRSINIQIGCHVGKRAITVVVIEAVGGTIVRYIEVGKSVVIIVAPGDGLGKTHVLDPGLGRDIGKSTISFIAK